MTNLVIEKYRWHTGAKSLTRAERSGRGEARTPLSRVGSDLVRQSLT
jgi:hypothetical protein